MKATNTGIIERSPCINSTLRAKLHALKVGEVLQWPNVEVTRVANSLARSTKKASGTTFEVRTINAKHYEVQCVRYYAPRK